METILPPRPTPIHSDSSFQVASTTTISNRLRKTSSEVNHIDSKISTSSSRSDNEKGFTQRRKLFFNAGAGGGSYSMSYVYSMAYPTSVPSSGPTETPLPSSRPSISPTSIGTNPTNMPSSTWNPTGGKTRNPSPKLTYSPSGQPSSLPTGQPSGAPSASPTSVPSSSYPTSAIHNARDRGFTDKSGLFFVIGDEGTSKSSPGLSKIHPFTMDISEIVGRDAGGFALSKSKVFLTGESHTAAFSKETLSSGTRVSALKGASFCSNIATSDVYVLADSNLTPLTGPGQLAFLMAVDDSSSTIAPEYRRHVTLNTPISLGYNSGIFSGYNRVVVVDRDSLAVWNINVNNGHVVFVGSALCKWAYTRSWASTGIAEFSYGKRVHLLYGAAGGGGIERQSISGDLLEGREQDITTEMVYDGNLGELVSFGVDISADRWYFQYTGPGDFGQHDLLLGYADASFGMHEPTGAPTGQPSMQPSMQPSILPSHQPSSQPSNHPTAIPSGDPSSSPSGQPSSRPIGNPTGVPSVYPTSIPSNTPTSEPSTQPTSHPTTDFPTGQPSTEPSSQPSAQPSCEPSSQPSGEPSSIPSAKPTGEPSTQPSGSPTLVPTNKPTQEPTRTPTGQPTLEPSAQPSGEPSGQPTSAKTKPPTPAPSAEPTIEPTPEPSALPTLEPVPPPTAEPTPEPSAQPTRTPFRATYYPTGEPSGQPTSRPTTSKPTLATGIPSEFPTSKPTSPSGQPTGKPSRQPISMPTGEPSSQPTSSPTGQPSRRPSRQPTAMPTSPTGQPSTKPTGQPSSFPSAKPSTQPSGVPTSSPAHPTGEPSAQPSSMPTSPTGKPSTQPSRVPSGQPSSRPSTLPSSQPTSIPSQQPSARPSSLPSGQPSREPSGQPSASPTRNPSAQPSSRPSRRPSGQPTRIPSSQPSSRPSRIPSSQPSCEPSGQPTRQPSSIPSSQPSGSPTKGPTGQPSSYPTTHPSGQPSRLPSSRPSGQPSRLPTGQPTLIPSSHPTMQPSRQPTGKPSGQPSRRPTGQPTKIPSSRPSRTPVHPTGKPSGQPTRRPSGQPTSAPLTSKPTRSPTILESKMFKKNNVVRLKFTQSVKGMSEADFQYKYVVDAFSRAIFLASMSTKSATTTTTEYLRNYIVDYIGTKMLSFAFSAFESVTSITNGVTLVYEMRLVLVPNIIADDGSIIMSLYTPWVAARKELLLKILTAATLDGSILAAAIAAQGVFQQRKLLGMTPEMERRKLATAFDEASIQSPVVSNPSLVADATFSPSPAPTEVPLSTPSLIVTQVNNSHPDYTGMDLKHSIVLNVSISAGSYAGVITCGASVSAVAFASTDTGAKIKQASYTTFDIFSDSVGVLKYHILTLSGLMPATTYYSYCYLEITGKGLTWIENNGADIETYGCRRVGVCSTTDIVKAAEKKITTKCCKDLAWNNPPASVFWDVFTVYANSDKSYYFKFALSEPPGVELKITVAFTHCSLLSAGYCISSGEDAITDTEISALQISTKAFTFNTKSAAYAGAFFITYPSAVEDSTLGGYVGLSITAVSNSTSASEYAMPSPTIVRVLDKGTKRPPPKILAYPNGARFSDSGSYAVVMLDAAAEIVGSGFITNRFVCSRIFSFPDSLLSDKKTDSAAALYCTWLNTTAIRVDFADYGLSNLYDSNYLPVVGHRVVWTGGVVPSFCPIDPKTYIKANCTGWEKNAEQTVPFSKSNSALKAVATINAPYTVSACEDPTIDAGSSQGNGGRAFIKVNWVIKFIRNETDHPQLDIVDAINSVGYPYYKKDYYSNGTVRGSTNYKHDGAFTVGLEDHVGYQACVARKSCLSGPRIYNIEQRLLIPPPLYSIIPRAMFNSESTFKDIETQTIHGCGAGGGCGAGTYQIYFSLENFLGSFSEVVLEMRLTDRANVPSAIIEGLDVRSIKISDMLEISSAASLSNCSTARELSYDWAMYPLGVAFKPENKALSSSKEALKTTSLDKRKFKLFPYTLSLGDYVAVLTVIPIGSKYENNKYVESVKDQAVVSTIVSVGHSPVVAAVIGGYSRNTSVDRDITIDAYKSQDYDLTPITGQPCPTINYRWSCIGTSRKVSGVDCTSFILSAIASEYSLKISGINSYKIYFPADTFEVGESYDVSIFASTVDGRFDSKTVSLSITRSGTPAVAVTTTASKFNANSALRVFGSISAGFAVSAMWSVYYSGIQVFPTNTTVMEKSFSDSEAGNSLTGISFPLAFKPDEFIPGRAYSFRLSASPLATPELAAAAEIVIICNTPPTGGMFTIATPENTYVNIGPQYTYNYNKLGFANGTALTTKFTITVSLWSSDPENLPMQFEFQFQLDQGNPELLIQEKKASTFVSSAFPAGYPQNDYTVIVINRAYDKFLASAKISTFVVVVNPPGDQSAFLFNALSSGLSDALSSGNPDLAYQTINNVASAINGVNCTGAGAQECSRFNRSACLTVPQTCESCIAGFTGIIGPSNTQCFNVSSNVGKNGYPCKRDSQCLYNFCDEGLCSAPLQSCPSGNDQVCSGNGECQFADTAGNIKSKCTIQDVYCRASCVCKPGYASQDCSLSEVEAVARDGARGSMCSALYDTAKTQDPSAQMLDSLVGSLLSSFNPSEIITADSKSKCKLALSTMSSIGANGYLKGAKPETITFLTKTVSSFIAPAADGDTESGAGANTAIANLVGGVTQTTVAGEAPTGLVSPNVRVSVNNAQLSSLTGSDLAPPSTDAEAAYGAQQPKVGLPDSGFSQCGMPASTSYAQISTMQWGSNPYADSKKIKSPILRFSNGGVATSRRRRMLTPTGKRGLKVTSRKVKLLATPIYYITLQFSAAQNFNFSHDLTKKPKRGSKSNFSLPRCQLNNGKEYVDCYKCNVSSYTNTNVTYGCFDIAQLCPPGSAAYKMSSARRHLTDEELDGYEVALYKELDAEEISLSERDRMLYDGEWRERDGLSEEERKFYGQEDAFNQVINTRRRRLQEGDDDSSGDSGGDPGSAVSNFGALLAAILAQLAATLSSNPFNLDPEKSKPILIFISTLGFTMLSGVFYFLRWDTYDHNYEMYVKEAHSLEKRKAAAANLTKGGSTTPSSKPSSSFNVSAAFTSMTRQEWRSSNLAAPGTTVVATTNTTTPAYPGDVKLEVGSSDGFKIGMLIEIGTGSHVERLKISGFGSLLLESSLKYYHPRGAPIVGYEIARSAQPGKANTASTHKDHDKEDSIGYASTEEDTASTGDVSAEGSADYKRSVDGDQGMTGLAAGYMEEFMSVVMPAKSLLSESHFLGRLWGKIVEKHNYLSSFGSASMHHSRLIRWMILCQVVLIGLFIDTLFFGTFFPDDTTCPSLVLKEMCVAVPSQINPKGLCKWTKDEDPEEHPSVYGGTCALRPPPEDIIFTVMVAVLCAIFSMPVDLFMTTILELFCRKRPMFELWGWNSDRIVGTSTEAYKPENAERVSHLGKLMEEVGTARADTMSEEDVQRQNNFMARQVYLDFISPQEEATALLKQVKTFFTEDLEDGALPWEFGSVTGGAEKLARVKAIQKSIGVHGDMTAEPLTLREWLMYGTPRNRLEQKIAKARKKASAIEQQLEEFQDIETDLKDIALIQHFILEQLTPIRRYALKLEFFIFDGTPDETGPLKWIIAWCFYSGCLMFFVYWLFAWGVKQGGTVLMNWGMNFLIGAMMDIFGVSVLRILILDIIGLDAIRPQLRVIRRVLTHVGITYCQENTDRSREVRIVQHMSPACRAARTFAAKSLASAQILRHIDDLDVERCRENRSGGIPTWMLVVIAIPAVAALINDNMADFVIGFFINLILTSIILLGATLYTYGDIILTIPFIFLGIYLVYKFLVLEPARKRTARLMAEADQGTTRRWKSSGRLGSQYTVSGWVRSLTSSLIDSCARCVVYVAGGSAGRQTVRETSQETRIGHIWQRMNIPLSLQGRVLSEAEHKKHLASQKRLVDNKDQAEDGLRGEILALMPAEICNMRQSEIHNDWKYPQPWRTAEFADRQDPNEAVVFRNSRRRGPGMVFKDSAITQSAAVACQRMLQSYIGDAMTPDDDFQYYSNLVDATKFDNFIYTPELIAMVGRSWDTFYPGGIVMSETERAEMRDHLLSWVLSVAGPSGQGVKFAALRRWYISECNRISRIRYSSRKKQFVPAALQRAEAEKAERAWMRSDQPQASAASKKDSSSSDSGSDSSSDSGIRINAFRDKRKGDSGSSSGDGSSFSGLSGFNTDDSKSSKDGIVGVVPRRLDVLPSRPMPAPGAFKGIVLDGASDTVIRQNPFRNHTAPDQRRSRGRGSESSGDDVLDLDGWDSDSDAGGSLVSSDGDDSVVLSRFDPRPFDINKPRSAISIATDLTVGTLASSLNVFGTAVGAVTNVVTVGATAVTTNPLQLLTEQSESDEDKPSLGGRRRPAKNP